MEENLEKIFAILEDRKNESLFKIYINQIAEINKNNPRSSTIILDRAIRLTRSSVWECRLVAASILEKVIDNHLAALKLFGENEQISLEIIDGMFIIEEFEPQMTETKNLEPAVGIDNIKSIINYPGFLKLDSINYQKLMNTEAPLLSRDTDKAYKTKKTSKADEEKLEDEIFKKLETINDDEKNMLSFMEFIDTLKNENPDDKGDMKSEDEEEDNDNEMAIEEQKGPNGERKQDLRGFESIDKKHKISDMDWKRGETQNIRIRSIFKMVYDYLGKNLFDPKWEIRHGACIALRNFIKKDIHKLYISTTLDKGKLAKVDDHEESLSTFIRDTIRLLTFSNDFFEDFLARQLVVIALDRFMDHSSDRTQIIVRENSCQAISKVLALLLVEDPAIHSKLYKVVAEYLIRKEWEIKIGALYLLKYVMNTEKGTCKIIFDRFGEALLSMIESNDDVLCILAECLEIFINTIPFKENIQFFIRANQQLWKVLEFLDDISFSNAMVASNLNALHQKEEFNLLYPDGFKFAKEQECLLPLFQHKISAVRSSVYALELSLIKITQPQIIKANLTYFKNLFKLAVQNLMIESTYSHVDNLLKLLEALVSKMWDIDAQYCLETLTYLLSSSGVYDFKSVVQKFISFSKNDFAPYSFVDISTDPTVNFLQAYERILKTGILFNRIMVLTPGIIQHIKAIFAAHIDVNHFSLLCYLFTTVESFTEYNNNDIFNALFEKSIVDNVLTWSYSHLKLPYLDMVQISIRQTLDNLIRILKTMLNANIEGAGEVLNAVSAPEMAHPANLESLYNTIQQALEFYNAKSLTGNLKVDLVNCIQSLQYQINDYVTRGNEFANTLKCMTAGLSIISSVTQQKPLEKLNAIIRPVISSLLKPNFTPLSKLTAFFLFNIIKAYEGSATSPVPKVFKNIFASIFDEKIRAITEQQEVVPGDLQEKKKVVDRDYIGMGRRYDAFVEVVRLLLERNQDKLFTNYPFILEALVSEFLKLKDVEFSKISAKNISTINLAEIYKNLKMMNILKKIQKEVFSLKESQQLCDNLVKAYAILNLVPEESETEVLKYKEKCTKICLKLMRVYISVLRSMKKDAEVYKLLENLYVLLKRDNVLALKFLNRIHEIGVEEFIDFTKIFIVQCIKKINSENPLVRKHAVKTFASIINCIFIKDTALDHIPSEYLKKKYKKGFNFVFEFKNNKNFHFEPQTKVEAKLRGYQLEGVKWLSFLMKYNMSAALCDDMGLGKTLQTLVVLQEEISKQLQKPGKMKRSLVVVPSSLTEHWHHEIRQFCDPDIVKPYVYSGSKNSQDNDEYNVIIMSYLSLSKGIENFKRENFFFLILDEAHLVKNPKSKIYKAMKQVSAQHKIALTGTPIQNNVAELWSIFDVIMPGYLGDEEYFRSKYAKYFNVSLLKTAAKDMVFTSEQDEILEELHRKVKPFIMRRDKMSVLSELPPKVIQDYYCQMTEKQEKIYQEFERIQASDDQKETATSGNMNIEEKKKKAGSDVFQMLNSLRRICNHPALFFEMPNSEPIQKKLNFSLKDLQTYEESGKLIALKDLLNEMGFEDVNSENGTMSGYATNPNKILLFSRYKETLDVIIKFLLTKLFPKLNYLRIDGSVPSSKRFELVKKFNRENEIKMLLMTTGVGGVGFNLHTANVVIMFDHDYNPMNDLQAIDRAHRIGQKNVLNVYRLIIKDTLEEQIMGIQRFKLNVANSVINLENSSIDNVKQSNLLSLFSTIKQEKDKKPQEKKKDIIIDKYSKILEEVGELWDEEQYQKDYRENEDS